MASTRLNLLLDVGFNREVAEDSALYWTKKPGNLASLIDRADDMGKDEIEALDKGSIDVIRQRYSWRFITEKYEDLLIEGIR